MQEQVRNNAISPERAGASRGEWQEGAQIIRMLLHCVCAVSVHIINKDNTR